MESKPAMESKEPIKTHMETKNESKHTGTGHKRLRKETFNAYIYKVLKQVHSEIGISKRSKSITMTAGRC